MFLFHPSYTLSTPQPAAHGVIRQYGLLLFVVNVVLGILIFGWEEGREKDKVLGRVWGALGVYHVGPMVRAMSRWKAGNEPGQGKGSVRGRKACGGPDVVASLHAAVLGTLVYRWVESLLEG